MKIHTIALVCALALVSQTASAQCDTLTNLRATDSLLYYTFDPSQGTGYISGNNSFGDLEKAEGFSGPVGSTLTGASIGFGYVSILPADSSATVTIRAYDATGSGGSPGAAIDSATVTFRQIAAAVAADTGVYVPFSAGYMLTAHGFYVSVVLPTTGDTVVVLTDQYDSQDGNGWENTAPDASSGFPGGWYTYQTDFATFPYVFGNDIQAVTCGGGPLAAFQSSLLNNCGGSPATVQFYNTSSNGASSFSWSFSGGTASPFGSPSPLVTFSSTGVYPVQLIAYDGALSDTVNATVNVFIPFRDSISTTPASNVVTDDGTATVTAIGGSGVFSYFWEDHNEDQTATATGLAYGTYYVIVTDSASGCPVIDSAVVTHLDAIISIGGRTVRIYPIPATDLLHVDCSAALAADMTITDMSGRQIARYAAESTVVTLDIHALAAGTYVLHITDRTSQVSQSVHFMKY